MVRSRSLVLKRANRPGELIRKHRLANGWRMHELAAVLGCSHQQVQKYETGKDRVKASQLWRIAEALKVPVHRFIPSSAPEVGNKTARWCA